MIGDLAIAITAQKDCAFTATIVLCFAMITRKIAGFELSEDQTEYKRDENGRFIITQTEAQKTAAEYWQGLLQRFPYVEIT
ncbi:MAG: hypothetical protein IJD47_05950, partial [Clostridia bacterium]|nr:hypothetical protein [Clostridia bacterium]